MYAGRPKAASPSPIRETTGPPAPSVAAGMRIRLRSSLTMGTTLPAAFAVPPAPRRALVPPDRGQPGLYLRRAVHRVDLEGVGGNRLDGPAVAERRAQLLRVDPARAPGPWLPVAEAHEVA